VLVGATTGPGVLVAAEDIPAGAVIAAGSALLALASAVKTTLGPRGRNMVGVASRKGGQSVGQIVEYVAAGPLELDTASWDVVTDSAGGLVPSAIYYVSQTTPGHMTTVRPDAGQIVRIGIALSPTVLDVQLVNPADFVEAFIFDPTDTGGVIQNNGSGNKAAGQNALAQGEQSSAPRESQEAFASGAFNEAGDAQTSKIVLRGSTPGLAVNEAVELKYGIDADQTLQLEDGKTYAVKVVAACGGVQGLSDVTCVLELSFSARRSGGTSSIQGSQVTTTYGDATTWTLAASIGAGPDRIVLMFSTGAGPASIVNVAARTEFTEVVRPTVTP
jgi:hypothetical protein